MDFKKILKIVVICRRITLQSTNSIINNNILIMIEYWDKTCFSYQKLCYDDTVGRLFSQILNIFLNYKSIKYVGFFTVAFDRGF